MNALVMRQTGKFSITAVLVLYLGSFASFSALGAEMDQVPVIGLDENEAAVVNTIPLEKFQETMKTAFSAVQGSLLSVLDAHEASLKATSWRLQTIGIGIGLQGQLGLGPVWNITASPRLRLIFTNSNQPVYPD
jgi:hypothetical protein